MRMPLVNLLSISLVVVLFTSSVAAQTPVGYVLEIQGDWYLNGDSSSTLRRWQKLPPAGTISIKAPTPDARIVIASLNDEKTIDSRSCEVDGCSRPIKLPGSKPQRSMLWVAIDGAVSLLFGSPQRYVSHRTRASNGALSEGVVRWDKGEIDFSPVLKYTGRCYLRWRARPLAGQVGKWSDLVAISAGRGQPVKVAAPDFKPGVYEINLRRPVGDDYETFASAWVLVSASPQYENAAASFQQALDLTEQWGDQVSPETSQQFLRAHLDHLAEQAVR